MIEGNDDGNIMEFTKEQLVCLKCVDGSFHCYDNHTVLLCERYNPIRLSKLPKSLGAVLYNNASKEPSCLKKLMI